MTSTSVQTTRLAIWRPRTPSFIPGSTLTSRGLCNKHQGSVSLTKLYQKMKDSFTVFRWHHPSPLFSYFNKKFIILCFLSIYSVLYQREQLSFLGKRLQHEAEATYLVWTQRVHSPSFSPLQFSKITNSWVIRSHKSMVQRFAKLLNYQYFCTIHTGKIARNKNNAWVLPF